MILTFVTILANVACQRARGYLFAERYSLGPPRFKRPYTLWSLSIVSFSAYEYGCFSAADSQEQIGPMVKEAILSIVKVMVQDGIAIDDIKDAGYMVYAADPEYRGFDNWVMVEIDRSEFEGKPQRINVSLPDTLIKRIDNAVKGSSEYKDRSHFIAEAARHKLKQ